MTDTAFTSSYIETDAELETLIGSDPRASAIALKALAAASQGWYCQEATRHIDALQLRGQKWDLTTLDGVPAQVLEFPRLIDGVGVGNGEDWVTDPAVPDLVKRACLEEAIAIYDILNTPDKKERLDLQRQGVTGVSYSGTSEQYGGGPNGGGASQGAGNRFKGLLSFEAFQIMRRYIGAVTR